MIDKLKNLIFCNGWSFKLLSVMHSRATACPEDIVYINGAVRNNGIRLGCCYLRLKIASPYDHSDIVFDSHRNLEYSDKVGLRVIDLPATEVFQFSIPWHIDKDISEGIYYYRVEIWNTPKLFNNTQRWLRYKDYCFDRSPWKSAIEILQLPEPNSKKTRPKVFISYSWDSDEHQSWVLQLADHLLLHNIDVIVDKRNLLPGEEITEFIERGIIECSVILFICSEEYTKKANARLGGVGMETVISTARFLNARKTKKFIPIVRNNSLHSSDKLPVYLGSTLYVDMDIEDWQGVPLQQLLRGISVETGSGAI